MHLDLLSERLIQARVLNRPLQLSGRVGGGCINSCFRVISDGRPYFLKVNDASAYPGMFDAEAEGLSLLRRQGVLMIPEVYACETVKDQVCLLMEFVESGRQSPDYWQDCGTQLARLHKNSREAFGLDGDNYIGSLPQYNSWCDSWADFYLDRRLVPQLELGLKAGWCRSSAFRAADGVARTIEGDFPKESPALMHGDLWSGNLMTGPDGQPVLVDPAVYYGNREMEITFTRLFGGFGPAFYEYYQEEYPLQPGFTERMEVHNLYPLMVHANLFGGHYVGEVMRILGRY